MFSSHHVHSLFSDGRAEPEAYILQAIELGFDFIGFTEHSPLPYDNSFSIKESRREEYIRTLDELKQKYAGKIRIARAMEMDYIPNMSQDFAAIRKEYQLDYQIGSVHLVANPNDEIWFIDGPNVEIFDEGLSNLFQDDIRLAVTSYWNQLFEMVETQTFEIVGHLDKIKMHNKDRFFKEDEKWYCDLVHQAVQLIKEKDLIVEINTRGIYKKRSNTTYPGLEILRLLKEKNIPVVVNSDAHLPSELNAAYDAAYDLLKQAGIREEAYYTEEGWKLKSIEL